MEGLVLTVKTAANVIEEQGRVHVKIAKCFFADGQRLVEKVERHRVLLKMKEYPTDRRVAAKEKSKRKRKKSTAFKEGGGAICSRTTTAAQMAAMEQRRKVNLSPRVYKCTSPFLQSCSGAPGRTLLRAHSSFFSFKGGGFDSHAVLFHSVTSVCQCGSCGWCGRMKLTAHSRADGQSYCDYCDYCD